MHITKVFQKHEKRMDQTLQVENFYDTIIIGSGIGGLSCASVLAQCCLERVLVLEQHPTELGGCTHEFERKGVEFDTGIHYIGGDMYDSGSTMRRIFDFVTAGGINWLKMDDTFDFTVVDGDRYEIRSGFENQRNYLKRKFPNQPIDEYFDDVIKTSGLYTKFILSQIASSYLPLFFVKQVLMDSAFGSETVNEALDRLKITEPRLQKILTYCYGDYGPPPSKSSYVQHCMTVFHYANGSSYPVNGPHLIAERARLVVERFGGKLFTNSKVSSIYVENGEARGVYLENNPTRPIRAKKIVSAAGAFNTYTKFLQNCDIPKVKEIKEVFLKRELEPSNTFAMIFVILNGNGDELSLPSANIWVQDSKNFPYVFLSFPSKRDSSWINRHPERSVCEIIVEVKYSEYTNLNPQVYQIKKKELANKALQELFRQYPNLENRVHSVISSTPRTVERFLGSQEGCAYGIAATPARYRAARDWLKPQTPIKNLFLTGQDIISCGMCGGMFGGLTTAAAIDLRCLKKMVGLIYPISKL